MHGAILSRYLAYGKEASALGLPTSNEFGTSTGRANTFQHGRIDWNARTGAVTVTLTK